MPRLHVFGRGITRALTADAPCGMSGCNAVADAGRQPRARSMDLLIAATAHAHAARLYTRNAADFRGLDDLVEVITV